MPRKLVRGAPARSSRGIVGALAILLACLSFSSCSTLKHQALQQRASEARTLTYEGLNALDRGQPARAQQLLADAAELAPEDHRIQEHLAESLSQQGQLDNAIEQMERAVELSDNEPQLHVQLGNLYLKKSQPQHAETQARLALKNDRRNFAAWKLLGQAQAAQNAWSEALRCLHRATCYQSDDPETQLEIARIYHRQGRDSRALTAIETLRQSYPPNREPMELLALEGQVLLSLDRPHRAIARLQRIADDKDASPEAYLALCQAYRDAGDYSNAQLMAAVATELHPGDQRFANLVADLPQSASQEVAEADAWR